METIKYRTGVTREKLIFAIFGFIPWLQYEYAEVNSVDFTLVGYHWGWF